MTASAKKQTVNSPIGEWILDQAGLPCFEYVGNVPYKATLANGDSVKLDPDPWFVLGNNSGSSCCSRSICALPKITLS